MMFLIGIDDTDNKDTPGTEVLALKLGKTLEEQNLGRLMNISVHDLLRHPDISYTNKNQTYCLALDADVNQRREIELVTREVLRRESAAGSNPGFALAVWDRLDSGISAWGAGAKVRVLDRQDAITLARNYGVSIAGFTGNGCGVIGALAAVGLRDEGNDGHFCWLPGLADLNGIYSLTNLLKVVSFDRVENNRGKQPAFSEKILIRSTPSPLIQHGRSVLRVKMSRDDTPYDWLDD
jgi:hypothetical protein